MRRRLAISVLGTGRAVAWTTVLCSLVVVPSWTATTSGAEPEGKWSPQSAWDWYAAQPWLVGCNFLPSTAVNSVEMWQAETFDPATIDRELGWARAVGLNSVRVFINYVVWESDAERLKDRVRTFLEIAARRGISVMPILLDDCNFAGREATSGPQPRPVPGVHNSQWVSSPPLSMVADPAAWPRIEAYVRDMVGTFANDRRIAIWDLYNEPGNSGMGDRSLPLVEAAFAWARAERPVQPLTVGAWTDFDGAMSRRLLELSDVISFHGYDDAEGVRGKISSCAAWGRPVLCTEWLLRRAGNDFEQLLPAFREHRVGCYHWGLVAGRTQTYYPWGSPEGAPEPEQWQHDLLRPDGSAYSATEMALVQRELGRLPRRFVELVPTARNEAVTWRYTLAEPHAEWTRIDFDDSAWQEGPAPFGRHEPSIGREPRTEWTGESIWLRRTFEWPADVSADAKLIAYFDEDPEFYLNGVLAACPEKWSTGYQHLEIAPAARATLRPGSNTLAVLCRQTWGGQYLDVGIGRDQSAERELADVSCRWTLERIWNWYDSQPWPCGFNYVPATAISYTEMWMEYCFDPATIDRELQLAEQVGFNTLRVVLPFVVWEAEPEAFKQRLDTFLEICERRGIRVMFTLFDDCVFGPIADPVFGPQPEVVPGWYANGWTPSPGHSMVRDPQSWPRLKQYVQDVMSHLSEDSRVWVWDLYNEPTNGGLGDVSIPLVEAVFGWAREVDPAQPLTVGEFDGNLRLNELIHRQSDVISFHNYGGPDQLERHIDALRVHGRPILCTEWLNRPRGSHVPDCLPVFRRGSVGCLHWGLVNGKTQTHLHWGARPGMPEPVVWQHDLFRGDLSPYDQRELAQFREVLLWNIPERGAE